MEKTQILIVEDEVLTAENIRFELANLGYEDLDIAMFGVEAVQKAGEQRPDLVLMDIKLPGKLDGIAAAEQIRTRFDIPVVYLTAYADDETLKRAKASEPFGYILKPFRVDALQSAIEMALYRHRTDKRLKESEARYRAIVEDQNELICRFLPDDTLTFVNGAYCRYFGQNYGNLVGKSFMPSVLEEDREWIREQNLALHPEEPVAIYEHRVRMPDGEIRWHQWSTRAIFDEQARLIEFQAAGRDITRRKQAEQQLQEQNAFLNTILESLTHPFYVIDANDYTIQLANSAARADGTSGEITCHALTHKQDRPCGTVTHPCPLERIKESKRPLTVEHVHSSRNGEPRYVEVHGYPLFDSDGNVARVIEYTFDITARKQAESEREKLIVELQEALTRVNTLSGLLPICASCKKIRDDQGYWTQVEVYIRDHSDARFSHGICPDCARELYPDFHWNSE